MSAAATASSSARSVAARIAASSGNDQAIVAQELQKLALYVDASPQSPKELDHEALDAVGADLHEGDVARLADLALSGELAELADELARAARRGWRRSRWSARCSGGC